MNKAKLKSYAPAARRDFIQAVTDRAHFFGISEKEIVPVEESGDVAIIGGRPFPRTVAAQRRKLDARVKRDGFSQVMEAVAYTWFNRFLALRYMELHGYLEHGFRVLSSTGSSTTPEILDQAAQLDLPGLNRQTVTALKLDGNKDAELYRILLVAQCNALHSAMPFLFEKIEDETELLLPDNLLHSDSLIRKLVTEIEEEDWQEVEIIGWLYQFYISEKKDQVIGSVVKSEDIPAATQLFTPNWIVKYMVQNSLGRQWMATYPNSPLNSKMEYYIEPADQIDEVKRQLDAITPESLDPEKITLLDPASGSGHILVEAYDVFKEIYLERGYSNRDFPRLILEKNLFGLDIDDRAAQMAGFALMMKARKDDRRILRSDNPVKLNVMAVQESKGIVIDNDHWGEVSNALFDMVELFKYGKTFGSLIKIPKALDAKMAVIEESIKKGLLSGDLYFAQSATQILPLVEQAKLLTGKFDCIVANPPYMGTKGMNSALKDFAKNKYPDSKSDMFSMFIERGFSWINENGHNAMVTMENWMFLSSFEIMRINIVQNRTIKSLIHMPYDGKGRTSMGISFGTVAVIMHNTHFQKYNADYACIRYTDIDEDGVPYQWNGTKDNTKCFNVEGLKLLPGNTVAYWASNKVKQIFQSSQPLKVSLKPKQGTSTGDDEKYVRFWFEINYEEIGFNHKSSQEAKLSQRKYFPLNKGGEFRRWFGNNEKIIRFDEVSYNELLSMGNHLPSRDLYFRKGVTWSKITSAIISVRYDDYGFIFSSVGLKGFPSEMDVFYILSIMNSKVALSFLEIISPTMSILTTDIEKIPLKYPQSNDIRKAVENNCQKCIDISKADWDSYEISWDFKDFPLLTSSIKGNNVGNSWGTWNDVCTQQIKLLQRLETENNKLLIDVYDLNDELTSDVPETQITLTRAGREADMKRLISYAIGCMMGRFSLDKPGLVYANNGNINLDHSKYLTFPADDDGIVPVMDMDWFPDDATSRFEVFLKVLWSPDSHGDNLKFVADSLSPKGGETPQEAIRRYISTQFYKDHLQTYKKRPIYWLFTSGKQRAFECLVYLHRYNESTLSRMRNEYVTPLQGKFSAQADYLLNEVDAADSTSDRNRLQKQLDTLRNKQAELAAFDDLLRHYADQRISLDLDDGVKVNYGKFGNLLADVKAVTGGTE